MDKNKYTDKGKIHYPTRIYRQLEYGEYCILFGDPGGGSKDEKGSFSAATVLSKKHLDFPITYSEKIDSAQFGYELYGLAQYIYTHTQKYPMLAVERNFGAATIHVLRTLNYPNMFHMVDYSAPNFTPLGQHQGSIGWLTTGQRSVGEIKGTRRKMLDDTAMAIRQGLLKLYDEEQLIQLIKFKYEGNVGKKGTRQDDLVFATSGSWEVHLVTPDIDIDDNIDVEQMKSNREKWRFR